VFRLTLQPTDARAAAERAVASVAKLLPARPAAAGVSGGQGS
jgi:hypothetical protein